MENDMKTENNAVKYTIKRNHYQMNDPLKRKLNKGNTRNQYRIKENNQNKTNGLHSHISDTKPKKLSPYLKTPTLKQQ
jgi:hypothetical protein